jgi:hypothetical protein
MLAFSSENFVQCIKAFKNRSKQRNKTFCSCSKAFLTWKEKERRGNLKNNINPMPLRAGSSSKKVGYFMVNVVACFL